jgi:hypothetical protein
LAEEEGEFAAGGKEDFSGPKKQDRFFRAKKPEKAGPKKQAEKQGRKSRPLLLGYKKFLN